MLRLQGGYYRSIVCAPACLGRHIVTMLIIQGGIVKKLIIAVLIVLVGLSGWAGATYVIGGQVEKRFLACLDRVEQLGPFQLTSRSYERGFLSSRARTVLEFKVPDPSAAQDQDQEMAKKSLTLTFEHTLRHGPLPAGTTPDGGFSLAPMLALVETRLAGVSAGDQILDEVLAGIPQLGDSYAFTIIGLGGGGSSRLMIPAFEKTDEEKNFTISCGGLTLDSQFSRGMEEFAGSFALPALQVRMEDGHLLWDGISGSFDMSEAFAGVYLGSSEVRLDTMQIAFADPKCGNKEIVIKGLDVSSQSSREGSNINGFQSVKLSGITVEGETYGPGLVEMELRKFDGEAFSHYQTDMLQAYREVSDPEEMVIRILPIYTRLFTELSKGSPEIELRRLQFSTPMGEFDGNARLKLHGEEGLNLGDLGSLMKNLEAEAKVKADENLVRAVLASSIEERMKTARDQGDFPSFPDEKISELAGQQVDIQLEALAQQKYLVRNNGKLSSHAVFNRGELVVNGQQLLTQNP
jgi:uncharacterized protein YdgA (DUF945 family)